jgi:predicted DNA-binding protein YlxM (UPF0122 family)
LPRCKEKNFTHKTGKSDLMSLDKTEDRLKEIVELTRLYDVYGPLLSDHKKEIFESYVLDNYSLGEIADQVGMSRQGVRDIVKRCSKELVEAEEKLGFLNKMDNISKKIDEARNKSKDPEMSEMLYEIVSMI